MAREFSTSGYDRGEHCGPSHIVAQAALSGSAASPLSGSQPAHVPRQI